MTELKSPKKTDSKTDSETSDEVESYQPYLDGYDNETFSDKVLLLVNKEDVMFDKIFINSFFLRLSKYFKTMFDCGMKESKDREIKYQVENEREAKNVRILIKYLYCKPVGKVCMKKRAQFLDGIIKDILNVSDYDYQELLMLLSLTDKMHFDSMFDIVIELLESKLDFNVATKLVGITDYLNYESWGSLMDSVEEVIVNEFRDFDKVFFSDKFTKMNWQTVICLLGSEGLITLSENNVYCAIVNYWKQNTFEENKKVQIAKLLLNCVRYKLLNYNFLVDMVDPDETFYFHPDVSSLKQELVKETMVYHSCSGERKKNMPNDKPRREVDDKYHRQTVRIDHISNMSVGGVTQPFYYAGYYFELRLTKKPEKSNHVLSLDICVDFESTRKQFVHKKERVNYLLIRDKTLVILEDREKGVAGYDYDDFNTCKTLMPYKGYANLFGKTFTDLLASNYVVHDNLELVFELCIMEKNNGGY